MVEPVKRQTAYLIPLKELIRGNYVKQEGWAPNYVLTSKGVISRIQFAGTIIQKNSPGEIIVDDGTASITVRSFENNITAELGQPVLIIGRPREYNNEIYVVSEIIRVLESTAWLKYFFIERKTAEKYLPKESEVKESNNKNKEQIIEEEISNNKTGIRVDENEKTNPAQLLIRLIRELDPGDGAPTATVLEKAGFEGAEEKLRFLIEEGEVFELRAGKIKVLE